MQEFHKINFKTPFASLLAILSVGFTAFIFWNYFKTDDKIFLVVGLVLLAFLIFALYYSLSSKVILTENEVRTKTLWGVRKLNYNEIKTIGVYAASNYVYILENENRNKRLIFEQKFIYLSAKPNYFPFFFKKPKDYLDFHYRREIYDIIESKMKACT